MKWLKFIRFNNLLIVAFTLYFLRYFVFHPAFNGLRYGISFQLDDLSFALLVWSTVMVTGAGNIINNYYDFKLDAYAGKTHNLVGTSIPPQTALYIYLFLALLGATPYFLLPIHWLGIYILFTALLWFYSAFGKKIMLFKNTMIATLCGLVPCMLVVLESESIATLIQEQMEVGYKLNLIMYFYIAFAFLSTFYRELVKDMEDLESDREMDIPTFPAKKGMMASKLLASATAFLLIIALYLFFWKAEHQTSPLFLYLYGFFLIALPTVFSLFKLWIGQSSTDFRKTSKLIKLIMLAGLFFLPLLV